MRERETDRETDTKREKERERDVINICRGRMFFLQSLHNVNLLMDFEKIRTNSVTTNI